jgi:hypothetical protein
MGKVDITVRAEVSYRLIGVEGMAWMRRILKDDVVVSRRVTVAQIKSIGDLDHSRRHGMLRHCQGP